MPLTRDELLRMYRRMLEIRIFEQSLGSSLRAVFPQEEQVIEAVKAIV